jgi:hypothetical protein
VPVGPRLWGIVVIGGGGTTVDGRGNGRSGTLGIGPSGAVDGIGVAVSVTVGGRVCCCSFSARELITMRAATATNKMATLIAAMRPTTWSHPIPFLRTGLGGAIGARQPTPSQYSIRGAPFQFDGFGYQPGGLGRDMTHGRYATVGDALRALAPND